MLSKLICLSLLALPSLALAGSFASGIGIGSKEAVIEDVQKQSREKQARDKRDPQPSKVRDCKFMREQPVQMVRLQGMGMLGGSTVPGKEYTAVGVTNSGFAGEQYLLRDSQGALAYLPAAHVREEDKERLAKAWCGWFNDKEWADLKGQYSRQQNARGIIRGDKWDYDEKGMLTEKFKSKALPRQEHDPGDPPDADYDRIMGGGKAGPAK